MTKKEMTTKKIMEAALAEFGSKGYELASTNTIYKAAGVSKGTIFLYFNSKSELFYHVFVYYLKEFVNKFNQLDLPTHDVYEKMVEVTLWKIEYFSKNPNAMKIFVEGITKPPAEIASKIMEHIDEITLLSLTKFFDDIDMSKFSSEYSKEEVVKYLQYALSGLQNALIKENISMEYFQSIRDDSMKYIKTILKGMEK